MAQLFLPFQYQADTPGYSTAFAGLPLYVEMALVSGVVQSIARHMKLRNSGWDDVSVMLSLILLNLAGGTCVNAAWWTIMLIALNLNMAMKRLVLGPEWINRRMKAVRYHVITIAGRLVYHARTLYLKVCQEMERRLQEWRANIQSYAQFHPDEPY